MQSCSDCGDRNFANDWRNAMLQMHPVPLGEAAATTQALICCARSHLESEQSRIVLTAGNLRMTYRNLKRHMWDATVH